MPPRAALPQLRDLLAGGRLLCRFSWNLRGRMGPLGSPVREINFLRNQLRGMTSAVVCPEVRPWCRFKGGKRDAERVQFLYFRWY